MSDSFHPEMAFFPMSVVLREFAPAAFEEAACDVLRVRLDENSCAALLLKKNPHFWIGNPTNRHSWTAEDLLRHT